jgi:hypothetical protein
MPVGDLAGHPAGELEVDHVEPETLEVGQVDDALRHSRRSTKPRRRDHERVTLACAAEPRDRGPTRFDRRAPNPAAGETRR